MMIIKNTTSNYGLISIILHWVTAVLIIGLFLLGLYMVELDYYDQWYNLAPWWHKSLGLTVFLLLLIRLFWKFKNISPSPLASYKSWEKTIAKATHQLFYWLILLSCCSGFFIATAKGVGIELFDWFEIPALLTLTDAQAENAAEIHELSNWLIVTLFILHVAATLKHHLIDKDITLIRILKPTQIED